jgi:hypothetical protein
MAGPVPAIHVYREARKDVGCRDKPGHDVWGDRESAFPPIGICPPHVMLGPPNVMLRLPNVMLGPDPSIANSTHKRKNGSIATNTGGE